MQIGNTWDLYLQEEFKKEYFLRLQEFLVSEYQNHQIFPKAEDVFNALRYTDYQDTKVVILDDFVIIPIKLMVWLFLYLRMLKYRRH